MILIYYSEFWSHYSGGWKFLWDCQLGKNIQVGHDLWQPTEMLVGQKKSLTDYFSRFTKFENVIGLEILSEILLLQMTYSLT